MNEAPSKGRRLPHREWHGAHLPWGYRPQAFCWSGEELVGINFVPIAREMRAWLQRRGKLPVSLDGRHTNPYTKSSIVLALVLGRVVNAYYDYGTSTTSAIDEVDAEIERIRLYNEVLLYTARFCEVAIKQLLYCTQIPESRYARLALGGLLESACPTCKKENGKKPHRVSLVGTLAHPFHMCLEFDHCALDHMDIVNKLRNAEAAHSDIQALDIRSIAESKTQLLADCGEAMGGFMHMLSHLDALEHAMLEDLADKGEAITLLKLNGLPAADCSFRLTPGRPFQFDPRKPHQE